MSTAIRIALLTLLVAAPVAAQPIQQGQIVLIKSNSGLYLSAHPSQKLVLSASTGGWEQWQYTKNISGLQLVSYHGTALLIGVENAAPFHAASGLEWVMMTSIEIRSVPGTSVYGVITSEAPALNGPVTLSYQNGSAWFLLKEAGGSLTTGHDVNEAIQPASFWTMVPVPAASRQPGYKPLQPALEAEGIYRLRSAHGTWLTHTLTHDQSGILQRQWPTHAASPIATTVELFTGGRPGLIHFGQKIWLLWKYGQYHRLYVLPASDGVKAILSEAPDDQSAWIAIDPAGVFQNGDRIPLGAKVILRSVGTGKHLSANPQEAQVLVSASKGGWEQWVITK